MSDGMVAVKLVVMPREKAANREEGTPRRTLVAGFIIGELPIDEDFVDSTEVWGLEIPADSLKPVIRWRGKDGGQAAQLPFCLKGDIQTIMMGEAMSAGLDEDELENLGLHAWKSPNSRWLLEQKMARKIEG